MKIAYLNSFYFAKFFNINVIIIIIIYKYDWSVGVKQYAITL